jgi:acyl-CoA reductase-like NAD-dependent aldehyde dehydrogenase
MTTITAVRFGATKPLRSSRSSSATGSVKTTWERSQVPEAEAANPPAEGRAFLAAIQESPAERMAEEWLAGHGITREQLKQMPPERRDATLLQMTQELRVALKAVATITAPENGRHSAASNGSGLLGALGGLLT